MNEMKIGRRERRRRKVEMKMEGNHPGENDFQKKIGNVEFSIESQSSRKLLRRDTYTVLNSKNVENIGSDYNIKSSEVSGNDSSESKNLTYSLNKVSGKSSNHTYNVDKSRGPEEIPPVPAPRKWKSINPEPEKVSSDTDRDITEISLDDLLMKSPKSDSSTKPSPISKDLLNRSIKPDEVKNDSVAPIPKPRKTVKNLEKSKPNPEKTESKSLQSSAESLNSKMEDFSEKNVKLDLHEESAADVDPPERPESKELPLIEHLQKEAEQKEENTKKQVDSIDEKKKKKKSRAISSLIKLDKKKIPKISSILKETKEGKAGFEEEKIDFQVDSPHYIESAENGRIYVQGKNGFYVMEKEDFLKNRSQNVEKDVNGGTMGDSTVKTAVLFQKYWSRSMTYFHGILAGFGFSHAATVTAIMLHFNYDPEGFIGVYSCLSLKIHYVFYTLTALCIVSCFDRIDIGHMNRKHWQIAFRIPSLWIVLSIYVISFALTFANQKTEVRLDAFPDGNRTEIWDDRPPSHIQISLLQWFYSVWARDVLVMFAWLIMALSNFDDFLFSHVNNMAKYAEVKEEKKAFRRKTGFF